jgi:hypothetical protein
MSITSTGPPKRFPWLRDRDYRGRQGWFGRALTANRPSEVGIRRRIPLGRSASIGGGSAAVCSTTRKVTGRNAGGAGRAGRQSARSMSRRRRFQALNDAWERRSCARNRVIVRPLTAWRRTRLRQSAWSWRSGVLGTGSAPEKGRVGPLNRLPDPARLVISDAYISKGLAFRGVYPIP